MLFENTAEIIGVLKANRLCRFGNTAASALYEKTEDFYAKVHFLFYIKKMTCQEHSRSSWRKIRFFKEEIKMALPQKPRQCLFF